MPEEDELNPDVDYALDIIDASIFSGDSFHTRKTLETLEYFLQRWGKKLRTLKRI